MLIPVVLSGGSGTRLWPVSRRLHPKQLLPLVGEATMLQQTVERLRGRLLTMAIAGKARIALERKKYQLALDGILASFERREAAAASLDGLNLSAVATAKTLLARLQEDPQLAEMATRLQTAIDGLDPVLLRPAAFEGQGGPSPDARRMGGMRGRRRQGR